MFEPSAGSCIGDQSIVLHTGPCPSSGLMWAAVFEGGPRAHLDGASALIASGLTRFDAPKIRVSVPRGAKVRRRALFDIRQTRRWDPETGVRRDPEDHSPPSRPSGLRCGRGPTSRRPCSSTMTVQQGLATPEDSRLAAARRSARTAAGDCCTRSSSTCSAVRGPSASSTSRGVPSSSGSRSRAGRCCGRTARKRYYLDVLWDDVGPRRRDRRHPALLGGEHRRRRAATERDRARRDSWSCGCRCWAAGRSRRVLRPDRAGLRESRLPTRRMTPSCVIRIVASRATIRMTPPRPSERPGLLLRRPHPERR